MDDYKGVGVLVILAAKIGLVLQFCCIELFLIASLICRFDGVALMPGFVCKTILPSVTLAQ